MSNLATTPKAKQTAYQRWELSSIETANTAKPIEKTPPEPVVDVQQITEQARQEGFALGLQRGYADGLQQARTEVMADKTNLLNLASTFGNSLDKAENEFAMGILKLSLDVAKAMLLTNLNLNSKAILAVVQEITNHLPPNIHQVRLMLHPEDAVSVKRHLTEELTNKEWTIIEDGNISRGGCLVETAIKHIDARIETRWKRICDALGQNEDWMESLK